MIKKSFFFALLFTVFSFVSLNSVLAVDPIGSNNFLGVSNAPMTGPTDPTTLNAGWWYNWSPNPQYFNTSIYSPNFVPMAPCGLSSELDPTFYSTYTGYLLVFNEPDLWSPYNSCNEDFNGDGTPGDQMPPSIAATRFHDLYQLYPNIKYIVGSVMTGDYTLFHETPTGIYWLDAFWTAYKNTYSQNPPATYFGKHCYLESSIDINYCKGGGDPATNNYYGFFGYDIWRRDITGPIADPPPPLILDIGAEYARKTQDTDPATCGTPGSSNIGTGCLEELKDLYDWVTDQPYIDGLAMWTARQPGGWHDGTSEMIDVSGALTAYGNWFKSLYRTYTLSPTADSYVDSNWPNTNYGNNNTVGVDGTPSSIKITYNKFDLTAYAGKTLNSAYLKSRVTNPSNNTHTVKSVLNTSWSELGITYNNRPPGVTVLSQYVPNVEDIWQSIDVTSGASSKMGQNFSFNITSSGSDPSWYPSKEHFRVYDRPELILKVNQ